MKQYPKIYEDLFRQRKSLKPSLIDSALGSRSELTASLKIFLSESYRELFRIAIRYLWLEKQITYKGLRRTRRFRNGHIPDQTFGRYMSGEVGIDQTVMTRSRWFTVVSTVLVEMFPKFLAKNPFEEPEYYEWPYEHIGLDFLVYVYQMPNRMELLDFANEKEMTYHDFKNWASNYVLSYNDDKGEEIYSISLNRDGLPYIKFRDWENWPLSNDIETTL